MRIPGFAVVSFLLTCPVAAEAQDRQWTAEFSVGGAGFLGDAKGPFLVLGGGVRRDVTPRISIGPEAVVIFGSGGGPEHHILLTGTAVFDLYPAHGPGARRVSPFLVAGLGTVLRRETLRHGPYWSNGLVLEAGGGIRAHLTEAISASLEYRLGSLPHHRITSAAGIRW